MTTSEFPPPDDSAHSAYGDPLAGGTSSRGPAGEGLSFHILLVEDHRDLGDVTAELLRRQGQAVELAVNGEEALRKARSHRPDIVICDLRLPDISGVDVVRRLRAELDPAPVFVALSAHDPRTIGSVASGDFDLCFEKPLDWNAVHAALSESVRPR